MQALVQEFKTFSYFYFQDDKAHEKDKASPCCVRSAHNMQTSLMLGPERLNFNSEQWVTSPEEMC